MSVCGFVIMLTLVVLSLVALVILWRAEPRNKDLNP